MRDNYHVMMGNHYAMKNNDGDDDQNVMMMDNDLSRIIHDQCLE